MSSNASVTSVHRNVKHHYFAHIVLILVVLALIAFFALTTTKIANGASQLQDGSKLTSAGAVKLQDGVGKVDDGAHQLAAGAEKAAKGASDASAGAGKLSAGATLLHYGVQDQLAPASPLPTTAPSRWPKARLKHPPTSTTSWPPVFLP
ncbi:hypothetical protein CVV68_00385 [Arthrobacter livingstonensis]|uniref:Uncharacterized protein n=1 Tax=Arthrobacter livingstonensis TaxID=670078 RepID=A0A2V5M2E7_9MICC|nr:hypothetical protein [Arthrobacter livingstonensis]PYI69606.1 hypothetical protein CVV68_00385 [Arthrobacter livingstonensis]